VLREDPDRRHPVGVFCFFSALLHLSLVIRTGMCQSDSNFHDLLL